MIILKKIVIKMAQDKVFKSSPRTHLKVICFLLFSNSSDSFCSYHHGCWSSNQLRIASVSMLSLLEGSEIWLRAGALSEELPTEDRTDSRDTECSVAVCFYTCNALLHSSLFLSLRPMKRMMRKHKQSFQCFCGLSPHLKITGWEEWHWREKVFLNLCWSN